MTAISSILVPLHEETVAKLMALRAAPSEPLAEVVVKLLENQSQKIIRSDLKTSTQTTPPKSKAKYRLEILGETHEVATLGSAVAEAINFLANLDHTILERFAHLGGRKRRHIARTRDAIHPGRNDLNSQYTIEFRRGWWMGTNYSRKDICRILKDLCKTAGLRYGRDISLTST